MNKIINIHGVHDSVLLDRIFSILKSKFTMVSIEELEFSLYKRKNLRNACHLTIDDGDKTFYNIIYPLLKKHNIPASIFVSPCLCLEEKNYWFQEIDGYDLNEVKKIISKHFKIGSVKLKRTSALWILKCLKIDEIWFIIQTYQKLFNVETKKAQNINVEQLLEIDKHGLVRIGAHTLNHPILANEEDKKCTKEIIGSFIGLREILGHEIKYFAYPNGYPKLDFEEREMNILKNCNCRIAFSSEPKDFTLEDNPLSIPRYPYIVPKNGFPLSEENYFRLRLFLGEYWEKLRDLVLVEEAKKRTELKMLLNVEKGMFVNGKKI